MKQLKIIPSDYICQLWDQIEHYFKSASGTGTNDYTVEQIKFLLVQGKQTLFVIMDGEKLIGAFSVEFSNYPNNKVMHIAAIGGKSVIEDETVKQLEDWARSQGATKIRAFAQEAQARLYRMKMGLNMVTHVVEKTI
jgi:hypothetical protein